MAFLDFPLVPELQKSLQTFGFIDPTPVQREVIPEALKGHDVRACAQTGSGKTIAFVLPILHKLIQHPTLQRPAVLIVTPTRELATQVSTVVHQIGRSSKIKSTVVLGGENFNRQVRHIRDGAQIVSATPGRLLDHLSQGTIPLHHVETLILDEADRMLDMGFLPDIRRILAACPHRKQTMMFSATFPPEIEQLALQVLKNPKIIHVSQNVLSDNVAQMVYPVSRTQKEAFLQALLETSNISSALIFCRTKHGADHLARQLKQLGRSVAVIHSDRSQTERIESLEGFRARRFQILVATDIASRGLDIKDISHVINFDVPHHPEDYVHRIGRTGRAQASGDAFTLVSPDEEPYLSRIEKFVGKTLSRGVIPNFPYLVPPRLISKPKSVEESFGRLRRRSSSARFRRFR